MSVLLRLLRLILGTIAGAIVAPIGVYVVMLILGVVQHYCWGPGADDSCLVSALAHLFIFMFVSPIPGAIVGFIVALCCWRGGTALGEKPPAGELTGRPKSSPGNSAWL